MGNGITFFAAAMIDCNGKESQAYYSLQFTAAKIIVLCGTVLRLHVRKLSRSFRCYNFITAFQVQLGTFRFP